MKLSDVIDDQVWGKRRTLTIAGLKLPWPFPVADGLGGSSAMVLGWPVFGADAPLYVKGCFRLFSKLRNARWWLQYRLNPRHQYQVIRTGLEPGYYDCDTLMLHGCMALLCRYVEDECGGDKDLEKWTADLMKPGSEGHEPRECVDAQAGSQSAAIQIYRWWKVERPADEKRRDELMMALYRPSRMKSEPSEHPRLNKITFEEFKGDEIIMEQEFRRLQKKVEDDEQAMLHRLIDIRGSLWT